MVRLRRLVTAVLPVVALVGCGSGPELLPGLLVGFVSLGTANVGSHHVELTGESGPALASELARRGAADVGRVRDALDQLPGPGERAFASVLPGCAETGALLVRSDDGVRARLTGGEDTSCAAAVYFLATFRISAELVGDAMIR